MFSAFKSQWQKHSVPLISKFQSFSTRRPLTSGAIIYTSLFLVGNVAAQKVEHMIEEKEHEDIRHALKKIIHKMNHQIKDSHSRITGNEIKEYVPLSDLEKNA